MAESDKIKSLLDSLEHQEKEIMTKNAEIAKNFFVQSFENKGFTDENLEAWEQDEDSTKGELMVKTGNLRNSIRVENVDNNNAEVTSDVSYAKFLNDGTSRMTSRKFMGKSAKLEESIMKNVNQTINKILKIS